MGLIGVKRSNVAKVTHRGTTMSHDNRLQINIPSQERLYQAIAERDAGFDGRFYYGVVTTGVFCRPSCAARLAKRENVRFYPDPAAATAAGFRACKRCRPDAVESDAKKPRANRPLYR